MPLGGGFAEVGQRLLLAGLGRLVDLLEDLLHHAVAAGRHLGDRRNRVGPARCGRGSGGAFLEVGVHLGNRVVDLAVQVRVARQLLGERALDAVELAADLGLGVPLAHLDDHLVIPAGGHGGEPAAPAGADAERAAEQPAHLTQRPVHRHAGRVEEDLAQDPQREDRRRGVRWPEVEALDDRHVSPFLVESVSGPGPSRARRGATARP